MGSIDWSLWQAARSVAVSNIEREQIRICDGCGSLAQEDLITDPVLTGAGPAIPMPAYPMVDPMVSAQAMLKGILPERTPETRTERLVCAMLDLSNMDNHTPQALVNFARAIESEIDRHHGGAND